MSEEHSFDVADALLVVVLALVVGIGIGRWAAYLRSSKAQLKLLKFPGAEAEAERAPAGV